MSRLNAERWRAFIRRNGERIKWEKAFRSGEADPRAASNAERDGRIYVEQSLASTVRALIHNTETDMEDREYGLFPRGSTQISAMPDEVYLSRLDRITLLQREMTSREDITRGSGDTDAFVHAPIEIVDVRQGSTSYADYELTATGIEWTSAARPAEGEPYAVEYKYRPVYIFLGENDRTPIPDKNGVLMPQRGILMLKQPAAAGEQ